MSQVEVDKIIPQSGTTLTIGDSGDTITVASGATLTGDLNADNLTSGTVPTARLSGAYTGITQTGTLASFASTGIDDNATSTAITINSSEDVTFTDQIFVTGNINGSDEVIVERLQLNGSTNSLGSTDSSGYIFKTGGAGSAPFNQAGALLYQPRTHTTEGRSNHLFYTGNPLALRQNIHPNGDISFYEDTGTTAKLFWDASAESLGIGTSTPTAPLTVIGGNNSTQMIIGGAVGTTDRGLRIATDVFSGNNDIAVLDAQHTSGTLVFQTVSSERMRIDSSGNVGIGTSSPSCKLQTNYVSTTAYSTTISDGGGYLAGANDGLDIENGNSTVSNAFSSLHFRASGTAGNAAGRIILGNPGAANSFFAFQLRDSSHIGSTQEKMRIDSSGNVGIGTSSPQEKLDIDGNIAISGNTLFEEVTSTAGMPSSAGNKSVNTNYDSTFSLTAGKWLILVNASLQVFQTSSNESGLYLLSLSLGSSAGADDYGLIQKAVLKWGNGSNSYGDNSGGHFPTLTLGSTTTLHTRWTVTEYGTASNFWVRGNLTRIRCIRIG